LDHLVSASILGYASSFLPYELHTDASGDALGAVLYQEQDGAKRVISYAERNYPTHKRESVDLDFFFLFGAGIRSVSGLLILLKLWIKRR
jgi:hypothetical protein